MKIYILKSESGSQEIKSNPRFLTNLTYSQKLEKKVSSPTFGSHAEDANPIRSTKLSNRVFNI